MNNVAVLNFMLQITLSITDKDYCAKYSNQWTYIKINFLHFADHKCQLAENQ